MIFLLSKLLSTLWTGTPSGEFISIAWGMFFLLVAILICSLDSINSSGFENNAICRVGSKEIA